MTDERFLSTAQLATIYRIRAEIVAAGETNSTGGPSCGVTSEELGIALGGVENYGAYLTDEGQLVEHAWVIMDDGAWIDATSDQFGGPAITYMPVGDPRRERYLDEDGADFEIASDDGFSLA